MHPYVNLTVGGNPVAGAFFERLISMEITDVDGAKSDTFRADLLDGPPVFLAMPRKGAVVVPIIGYRDTVGSERNFGRYVIDDVSGRCLPYSLSISGKAADLKAGPQKTRVERHWDNKTVKEIVQDVAADAGLEARVSERIGAFVYPWIGQLDEGPLHFVERLARRHGGLFSVKDGKLILAEKGQGTAVSGADLGTLVITPSMIVKNSFSFQDASRGAYAKVVAYWQNDEKARRVEVEVDADASASGTYRIVEPFGSLEEAEEAATAKAASLKAGDSQVSFDMVGDTALRAGRKFILKDVRPGLDGRVYAFSSVTHRFGKDGYTCPVEAKIGSGSTVSSDGG
ncbi:MAG: late control protein [Proteobacteria bacterium]|nr:late control protein [Pseudomonadota bacterium]